jgi:hypothetical protein
MRNSYSMRASAAVLGLSLILAGPVIAGDATKSVRSDGLRQSGTIVAIDQATRTITIDEMGPWHGEGTGMRRVTLRLRPDTNVMLVEHAPDATGEGYAASPLTLSDLKVGDFITLKSGRLGSVLVEVVRPSASDAEGRTVVPAASPSYETSEKSERSWPEAPQNLK